MRCCKKKGRHRCILCMPLIEVFAPAKVNLALHVTGQRADGYHLLDSLVAFAPVGDLIRIATAEAVDAVDSEMSGVPVADRLRITGPEAAGLSAGADNLVLRAAALMPGPDALEITLDKHLPAASGIGGGSSDAAATLRALALLRGAALPAGLENLGADVPMCLDPVPARVRGIGEQITPFALPPLPAILVNPRLAVPTPAVFRALTRRDNAAIERPPFDFSPPAPQRGKGAAAQTLACIDWLAGLRNDLEVPARLLAPEIDTVLAALEGTQGCRLARMSGSGATCFGLYETPAEAEAALAALQDRHPGWWLACGVLGDQRAAAAARLQRTRSTT